MIGRTLSFFKFIKLRQLLIPLSTVRCYFTEGDQVYQYLDVYVFGLRVARFHR